jgi:hypothetical protein
VRLGVGFIEYCRNPSHPAKDVINRGLNEPVFLHTAAPALNMLHKSAACRELRIAPAGQTMIDWVLRVGMARGRQMLVEPFELLEHRMAEVALVGLAIPSERRRGVGDSRFPWVVIDTICSNHTALVRNNPLYIVFNGVTVNHGARDISLAVS